MSSIIIDEPSHPSTSANPPPEAPTNPFNSRTVTYIRIGANHALRAVIFLRKIDWNWFDDKRLQQVITALFPIIPTKLASVQGVGGKESKDAGFADVYRGEPYDSKGTGKPPDFLGFNYRSNLIIQDSVNDASKLKPGRSDDF
ncbi:hypothetical protein HDV00_009860 [Rhizophlyctis rosea]|nr:hypothetical protein HDV00_009860 [Rhizophlyctis rosea]